jgi:N,N'-diacetylchitobiose phosphorylase
MGRDHTAFGRARHPWLTGSAGWNYVAATCWILGVRISFDGMIIDPCVPAEWKEFSIVRQWRGARFNISVSNPEGVQKGVRSITLDGHVISGAIPRQSPRSEHDVVVVMG